MRLYHLLVDSYQFLTYVCACLSMLGNQEHNILGIHLSFWENLNIESDLLTYIQDIPIPIISSMYKRCFLFFPPLSDRIRPGLAYTR